MTWSSCGYGPTMPCAPEGRFPERVLPALRDGRCGAAISGPPCERTRLLHGLASTPRARGPRCSAIKEDKKRLRGLVRRFLAQVVEVAVCCPESESCPSSGSWFEHRGASHSLDAESRASGAEHGREADAEAPG